MHIHKKRTLSIFAGLLAAVLFTGGCSQSSDSTLAPPMDNPRFTRIAIGAAPDIIVYGKGQPFDPTGLVVKGMYPGENDEETERILDPSEYALSPVDTGVPGVKKITVTAGSHTAVFAIMVNTSDKIFQSIALTRPPSKTLYEFGENINFSGIVITGSYSDGSTQQETLYAYTGYDRTKRGTQTIQVTINRKTVTFPVITRIPANAAASVNEYPASSADKTDLYKQVYVKGASVTLPDNLKVTVRANGVTGVLSAARGDFSAADFSGYSPNQTGRQTPVLTLDQKTVPVPVYCIDAEPELYFDYGYWRHEDNQSGAPPLGTAGQYTVPAGQTLVITPVVFFMTTAAPSYQWTVSSGLPYTTSGPGNKYLKVSPYQNSGGQTYAVSVTVSAGGVTLTTSTEIGCTASRPGTHPAEVPSQFNGPIPVVATSGNEVSVANIRNFGPGQFTVAGSGYGWSLGAFGGYEVWKLRREKENGAKNIRITGNPMATWREAGIIWVSVDDNQNGLPDDTWYELKGSDDESAKYRSQISRGCAIRYERSADYAPEINEFGQFIGKLYWVDNKGRTGVFRGGWPSVWGVNNGNWVAFGGTLLRDDGKLYEYPYDFDWGYVDAGGGDLFTLTDAVRADGTAADLPWIDFIKVQTGLLKYGGIFGEMSTEIKYADGLGTQTDFPMP
jgi:hypothetical protein